MMRKKAVTYLSILFAITFLSTGCLFKKEVQKAEFNPIIVDNQKKEIAKKPVEEIKKYDLYSTTPYELPLFSIIEISKLPDFLKNIVDNILEKSQGFYLLRNDGERILIILQNPVTDINAFHRHDLQFVEITKEGNVIYHDAGYVGVQDEAFNDRSLDSDSWVFDKNLESPRPLRHTVYDEKDKIKFTETWSYDENTPIKYQMKDSHKKTISILKETQESDSNYRKEHIFYDNEGNIKMSLVINYDGANISRLTFYNSHDSIDSMSIISEFTEGLKTKEHVYNDKYELVNTVISEYENDERKSIKLLDPDGNLIYQISI